MRTAVYTRISSDQAGQALGVQRQREDCEKLCADKGWTITEVYTDNDVSASSGRRRPEYERMLAAIRDGQHDAVVCWDLDRLHRRPVELERFMQLADERSLSLASVAGDVDLSTPQGRLIARVKGAVAAGEVEQMRARQLRAARQRAESGRPKWRKAFGYQSYTGDKGADTGQREPDPATAPLVAEAYRLILSGASLSTVGALFNDAGAVGLNGSPWTPATVSQFLRSPRNAGLRAHRGEIIGTGTWTPLVDESTWRATQTVLDGPDRKKPGRRSVRRHLLTGLLGCGKCGHYLSGLWVMQRQSGRPPGRPKAGQAAMPTRGKVAHSLAYSCKDCQGNSVAAKYVEPLLAELVAGRLAMPDAVDLLKRPEHDAAAAAARRTERATLNARLDALADDYAAGLLTGAQVARVNEQIGAALTALDDADLDAERVRIFDGLPLGTGEVREMVGELVKKHPDRYRAIVDALMDVTVHPVGKGGKAFNPERVQVNWR